LALGLALQPDGEIVLAGWGSTPGSGTDRDHVVARLKPDGSLDGSFAAGGKRSFELGGRARASALFVSRSSWAADRSGGA
jgi:hypothetical protein